MAFLCQQDHLRKHLSLGLKRRRRFVTLWGGQWHRHCRCDKKQKLRCQCSVCCLLTLSTKADASSLPKKRRTSSSSSTLNVGHLMVRLSPTSQYQLFEVTQVALSQTRSITIDDMTTKQLTSTVGTLTIKTDVVYFANVINNAVCVPAMQYIYIYIYIYIKIEQMSVVINYSGVMQYLRLECLLVRILLKLL